MQPGEISKGEFININEENDTDKWGRCLRGRDTGKRRHIKTQKTKPLRDISTLSKFKNKMLKSIQTHKGIKIYWLCICYMKE